MKIIELRILPPVAIGRLGSSETPLEAFELEVAEKKPLDYRTVIPQESFKIDPDSGKIIEAYTPEVITFKDQHSKKPKDGHIRPVAPFLEVFAITDKEPQILQPLTLSLLKKTGHSLEDISWHVEVGNIKIYRRTQHKNDKIEAEVNVRDHKKYTLEGKCKNFLKGKVLPLGTVQFIRPGKKHPGIRLRYTPAAGKVYGSSLKRIEEAGKKAVDDPVINNKDLVIYDKKGPWFGYKESGANPEFTNPAQIFAGYDEGDARVSWGYLDDECDGFVSVKLKSGKKELKARAHISAGPPAFAPDTLPVRVVSDELEQILYSPEVEGEVPIEEAEEIIRRAIETVRLMNTAVMNGNKVNGRENVASTMVRQDTNDFGRLYEPIMATSIVDNLAVLSLHERVYNGISAGSAPWFAEVLRRPDHIGNLSNEERRKMPALMRGADGRALTLTHRQINTVIKAAADAMFAESLDLKSPPACDVMDKDDLKAQIHYRGQGNPFNVLPRAAISNCFPGLEFDFRNLWRRAFAGITLIENNNFVIDADKEFKHLKEHRLVGIDGKPTMVPTYGPVFPGGDNTSLKTAANPNGVSFMEWSNNLAAVLQKQGKEVVCHFTEHKSVEEVVVTKEDLKKNKNLIEVKLKVNKFFEGGSAAFSDDILKPGELTQGLCAPWQNDYRECACYYWAASRPDYVNVEPDENGISRGDNWLAKERSGEYIPDNRVDSRLVSYDDLFKNWEGELSFIIRGKDALKTSKKEE